VRRVVVSVSFLMLMAAAAASAQTAREPIDFRHATTLGVSGGGAVDGEQTGPVAGAILGWQVSPRVAIEGSGRWFNRDHGSDAFAAAFTVQSNIMARRGSSLFVTGGLGMYHVDFGPASQMSMPEFYRRRMSAGHAPVSVTSFTDPAVVAGGGLQFAVSRHVILRPSVDTMIVPAQSRYHFVITIAFSLAYRFEQHPVTAVRRTK
jgi:hypothetical protein